MRERERAVIPSHAPIPPRPHSSPAHALASPDSRISCASVERKSSTGGTALKAVEDQITTLNKFIEEIDSKLKLS